MATKTLSRSLLRSGKLRARPAEAWHRCIASTALRPAQEASSNAQKQRAASDHERYTHFGYESVREAEKEGKVANVFSSVATSYDRMNDLMSLGIHRLWKDYFVRSLNPGFSTTSPPTGWSILDIAGGTGDIAFRLLDHAHGVNGATDTHVTVCDINAAMLAEGRKRAQATPYAPATTTATTNDSDDGATSSRGNRLRFLQGNAEHLDAIPSASVDLYTVAFGIRNFTDKRAALREAHRVLKPGGTFACLEFARVRAHPLLDALYRRWSFAAIPLIGQLVAADRDSYQYLVESIDRFPPQPLFRDMIRDAGFVVPGQGWEDLTGGIAAIHKGIKPLV
ncbi:MAG: 2-hexaprenyl-6-methoxy-1,4-benzoquinone methyltransferase [Claussenomyces sp. TS43310]|nr:MAG: 2-hexaprenyl-6-methoxy-1,4-benzoquinone methyltransferase [Claussenomyces sp. TS43310]